MLAQSCWVHVRRVEPHLFPCPAHAPHRCNRLCISCFLPPQDERSQHKNKAKALKVLCARLYESQQAEQQRQLSK